MHPVEEDGRFVIQPVYPDRQSCAEGEEHKKKRPSCSRSKEVPCRFRSHFATIVRKFHMQFSIAYRLGIIY
jgi:hypothetical protein